MIIVVIRMCPILVHKQLCNIVHKNNEADGLLALTLKSMVLKITRPIACYNVAIKIKADCLVDSGRWSSFTDGQIKADSLKALNCWQMTCLYNDRWQKWPIVLSTIYFCFGQINTCQWLSNKIDHVFDPLFE